MSLTAMSASLTLAVLPVPAAAAAPSPAQSPAQSSVRSPALSPVQAPVQAHPAAQPAAVTTKVAARVVMEPTPIKDTAGNTWSARSGFDGGAYSRSYGSNVDILGTRDDDLYRAELVRFNRWSRPVANGTYIVTLKMREAWWTKPGQRVFDVLAEGQTKLTDVDIYAAVGQRRAYDRTFQVDVRDGRLDLAVRNKKDSALVSAIKVNQVVSGSTPAPTNPAPTNPAPTPAPTTPAPTTPAPAPSPSSPATPATKRPSGLIFDSGSFPMHKADRLTSFERARGKKADVITVFPARESWDAMIGAWFMDSARIPAGYQGTLDVGVPLWPDDGNLSTATRGGYNAQWERFGRLIASRYPNAYIRLGWEMNLPGWKHAAYPGSAEQWKTAYRHAVTAIRKGGKNLRIAWVVNEGPGQTGTKDARIFYPGDAYVDFIGMDAYDWWPGYTTAANIARHRDAEYGWNFWLNFAKARGKKFVLPEWGVAPANDASGGDNPTYINFVYGWLKANQQWIGYESYFDESASYIRSALFSHNPKASAEYKRWMSLLVAR